MFANKRRKQEERNALSAALQAWFAAVGQARPVGLNGLTDGLLARVGSPYASLTNRGTADGDVLFYMAQALGRDWAAQLSRKAILETDQDAHSRSQFWESVSNLF